MLDGTDLNRDNAAGREMLGALRQSKAPNAQDWNGGIGPRQMVWLRSTLRDAGARREPVVLFCHFPLVAESSGPDHLLWNWREVQGVVDAGPTVAAWINGHDHRGGAAVRDGVQYLTLPGFVENKSRESCSSSACGASGWNCATRRGRRCGGFRCALSRRGRYSLAAEGDRHV